MCSRCHNRAADAPRGGRRRSTRHGLKAAPQLTRDRCGSSEAREERASLGWHGPVRSTCLLAKKKPRRAAETQQFSGRLPVVPPSDWRVVRSARFTRAESREAELERLLAAAHRGDLSAEQQWVAVFSFTNWTGSSLIASCHIEAMSFATRFSRGLNCDFRGLLALSNYDWTCARLYVSVPRRGQRCHGSNPVHGGLDTVVFPLLSNGPALRANDVLLMLKVARWLSWPAHHIWAVIFDNVHYVSKITPTVKSNCRFI